MKVLIIGCGYVGTCAGGLLAQAGHEVYGLRRSPWAASELEANGIRLLVGDLAQPETLEKLPAEWDWVINSVAASGGGAEGYRQTYLEGTRTVLEWLRRSPPRKYVYTSSSGVYGQNDGGWVDEACPTEPASPTAQVLVETETVLRDAAKSGFPAVILRVSGIYGPGRGFYLRQMLSGEARIEGEGRRYLNMIHRRDVAGAIIAALERGVPGEIYNTSDNEPVAQADLYRWLAEFLKMDLPPSVPESDAANRKRGVTNKRISNRKLRENLGYELVYPTFREGYAAELKGLRGQA